MRSDETKRIGGNAHDDRHDRRAEQRGPVGIVHGPVLRHGLEEHEDDDHFEGGADQHADTAEHVLGHHADQGGRDQLADEDQEQDDVEEPFGVLDQARQLACPPSLLVHQGLRLDPVHAHQAGLGQREQARGGEQDHDDDEEDGVLGVKPLDGDQRSGTWVR